MDEDTVGSEEEKPRAKKRRTSDPTYRQDGTTRDGTLRLLLADFVPDAVLRQLSAGHPQRASETFIDIPFHQLCEFLRRAERAQVLEDGNTSPPGDATPVRWELDRNEGRPM